MCGIVGVVGNAQATEILLTGLEKLEYRGYDSAGIYVQANQGVDHLRKSVGKIANLRQQITAEDQGTCGIGHTRWATHGKATQANAHPHYSQDRRFYLVHNGVLTNYTQLRQKYLKQVNFVSDTDTEVAVQLVAYLVDQEHLTTFAAFKKMVQLVEGSYAFALIDQQNPNRIFIAKNKSPLLVGLGKDCNLISSDAMALLDQTQEFLEIKDGEIGIIKAQKVQLQDVQGQEVTRESYQVKMDPQAISKGTYDSYMLKEIDEQPAVLRRIVQKYFSDDRIQIDSELLHELAQADRIYIVAAGTSYHAGLVGKNLLEQLAQIPVEVELASEFGYHLPQLSKHPFFIFLSQSGETADSRQALVQIKDLHYPILTLTNVPNSTLAREADYTLLLHAGPEIAVASTKAYTAQIAVQVILAQALSQEKELTPSKPLAVQQQLGLAANAMQSLVDAKEEIQALVQKYFSKQETVFFIGRGNGYAVALEAALKLKEVSYIHAEGFAAGELKHGTIALIEEQTPVVAFILEGQTAAHTRGNIREVVSRGAQAIVVSQRQFSQKGDQIIFANLDERINALAAIVPMQLLAYYAALERGNDVDQPRNLAKSVTVE
ncbi:glutamine--fructose-6-phosphate transaminase (isomerizing) [Lactobacillus sp. DCY120]|uniref:Glutamine--fructose-6-phosphate aminotransferase [isomerizing] n=1 Tax=Bombilactobacillus apium TaxID=2675299 RepID=A0A850R3Z7_9LACO|nr:glutamine--fructose-6-phosphate transaminase (isomerizing) [Bombilactobacillus apium]NVY97090.1 glutamine--fructose-6-phosphate transaminase (isomerizing) [Bombilactobacillus apium]